LFGTSDYYATLYGIKTFENPEQTVINILATPGIDIINNTELVRDTIEIVEEKRLDSIYLPTLPDIKLIGNNNAANTEDWLFPNDIIDELENTEIDSNYTAVYYPWIQISDTENNANLYIPPTAEVVRNLAFTDNVAHPWFATAGYNRGIVNCIRARIALDQESRDVLYPGRINPIATFSDVGNVIWGNRNLQLRDSALNRLNIRRLLLQARRLIVAVANRLLFDPNDAQVRSQFLSLVNPILDNIRKERGLTDFRVSLVNEVEDDDRNTLRGKIFIKPTPTLEFIELEFVVTPTSVSFDNI
jgi:phage tail sheath protein FI